MRAAILLFPALLAAQSDAWRGRCAPDIENRLEACTNGRDDVWHYTFREKKRTEFVRSWGYKSRERAQRALDADRRLCQTVDRYFDHTDCQTSYGEVFCAGCEAARAGQDWARTDLGGAVKRQAERWDGMLIGALLDLRRAEQTGLHLPGARFGAVFREYTGELQSAQERARLLQRALGRSDPALQMIRTLLDAFSGALARTEAAGGRYRTTVGPNPAPLNGGPPATAVSPMVSLTDQCAAGIPRWGPVCDQAVDALFARARTASGAELECLREWRKYHNCLGIYAHDSNPVPAPRCVRPTCSPAP